MRYKLKEEQSLFIPGPSGKIEALVQIPECAFNKIGIFCHPHPLYGGTMYNKVVHTLIKAYHALGLASVRFNFRGVGESEGHYAAGDGEMDDLSAVLDWVSKEYSDCLVWLGGFSFGSYIALKVASDYPIEQLILIAPPVENFPINKLSLPACPCVIVQGDADEVVPPQMVFDWVKGLSPQPTFIAMHGATHFFHGRLKDLETQLLEVLQKSCHPKE
jgi:uncharacterized protein